MTTGKPATDRITAAETTAKILDRAISLGGFHDMVFHATECTDIIEATILAAKAEEREACAAYHDDLAAQHEAFREDATGNLIHHHLTMVRVHVRSAAAIRKREG